MKLWQASLFSGLFLSVLFSLGSLIFYFGDWTRLSVSAGFGLFPGILAAPEFEPKAFKFPAVWQAGWGMLGGIGAGYFLQLEGPGFILSVIGGLLVGVLAPYWLKHLPVP